MEFRNSRYAALAATLTSCDELTLGHYKLLAGLDRLLQADPRKILAWCYFLPAFGLTPAQARRRVADLEAVGLIERQEVDFRRVGGAAGSRYALTQAGHRVVTLVTPVFGRAGQGAAPASSPSTVDSQRSPNLPDPLITEPDSPVICGIPVIHLTDLPIQLHQIILRLPANAQRWVVQTLGNAVDLETVEWGDLNTGVPNADLRKLIDLVRKSASGAAEPKNISSLAASELAPNNVRRRTFLAEGTQVPPAGEGEIARARMAGLEVPSLAAGEAPDPTLLQVSQMAVAEAATRYQGLLARGERFRQQLPELAWAVTEGSLADSGALIRRVRAALALMAKGRWGRPRGYSHAFTRRWESAVCLA